MNVRGGHIEDTAGSIIAAIIDDDERRASEYLRWFTPEQLAAVGIACQRASQMATAIAESRRH